MDVRQAGETAPALRVVVGEPDRAVRARLRSVLHVGNGIRVLGESGDPDRLCEQAARFQPRVAVVNAALRQPDGQESALAMAAQARKRTRVVVVSDVLDEQLLGRALRGGAGGFVHRESLLEEIVPAIRLVAAGHTFISSSMVTRLRDRISAVIPRADRRPAALTRREAEVLALVAAGLSNAGIAGRLGIGTGTVRSHLARILAKLSAANRAHAVGIAYESGVITGESVHRLLGRG
ncbi:LuxR C-terminal-related transcriptional regulator [Nonomuraea sp. ATR24]|uniref:response regulator transcription factor n=1 Tax=Nonomuraea TaxID=83681 RepID=UPI001C5F644E|nr:response regulator transcription factor [Nonomuraea ceibae]